MALCDRPQRSAAQDPGPPTRDRRPTNCPTWSRTSRARKPWPPGPNSPIWSTEAAGGLSDRDRSVLELAYRHGLGRCRSRRCARSQPVERQHDRAPAARDHRTCPRRVAGVSPRPEQPRGCPELAAILDRLGRALQRPDAQTDRPAHRVVCSCDEERQRRVSPVALLGAAPVFVPAPAWLRERTWARSNSTPRPPRSAPTTEIRGNRRRHSSMMPAVLFVAALVAALGLTVVWLQQQKDTTAVTPVEVERTESPDSADQEQPTAATACTAAHGQAEAAATGLRAAAANPGGADAFISPAVAGGRRARRCLRHPLRRLRRHHLHGSGRSGRSRMATASHPPPPGGGSTHGSADHRGPTASAFVAAVAVACRT